MERNHPHGFWQSVAGSLEWGETAVETAQREVFEETGLRAGANLHDLNHVETFPIIFPWKKRYSPHHHVNCESWFALQLPSRRSIRIQREEHRQYRWLTAASALMRASSWTNRAAIKMIEDSRLS